jgi:type IX secretion system PorP/SprF family membrane protein
VNASYRLQWAAQPQTPRTFHLSGEYIHNSGSREQGFNLAGGAALLRDRVGPLSLTSGYARVASLFAADPYFGAFSAGFSAGFTQYRLLEDRIVWETLDDPNIPLDDISTTRPEVGLGVYYFKRFRKGRLAGDNLYAGASVPQLWAAHVDVPSQSNLVPLTRVPHLYLTGGWYHFFNETSFLEVGMWAKYATGARPNVHLTGRFQPVRTFWVGGGFNPNGLVHLETGFNLPGFLAENGNLKIGYAFDYNISAFDLPLGSSHELHLSYLFDTRGR